MNEIVVWSDEGYQSVLRRATRPNVQIKVKFSTLPEKVISATDDITAGQILACYWEVS